MIDHDFIAAGLRFECVGCGACCRNHGECAYVYLTEAEAVGLALHLGTDPARFLAHFCQRQEDGQLHLSCVREDCFFLEEDGRCRVYPVRPKQCSTWPFWSENLSEAEWRGPVAAICPGIDRGPLHPAARMVAIAQERDEWYGYEPEEGCS